MARNTSSGSSHGRKPNFEIVARPDLGPDGSAQPRRILSVSYDASLARTREMLLYAAGFQVSTYTNSEQAIEACRRQNFDLIVIGHSIPLKEKREMLLQVRALCQTPILALLRYGEAPMQGADYVFDASQSPVQLLEMVINIFSTTK